MADHEVTQHSRLQRMLLLYVCRLFSSSLGLIDEPKEYGPIRLFCAAEELLDIMKETGMTTVAIEGILPDLKRKKEALFKNQADLRAFLEELTRELCLQFEL